MTEKQAPVEWAGKPNLEMLQRQQAIEREAALRNGGLNPFPASAAPPPPLSPRPVRIDQAPDAGDADTVIDLADGGALVVPFETFLTVPRRMIIDSARVENEDELLVVRNEIHAIPLDVFSRAEFSHVVRSSLGDYQLGIRTEVTAVPPVFQTLTVFALGPVVPPLGNALPAAPNFLKITDLPPFSWVKIRFLFSRWGWTVIGEGPLFSEAETARKMGRAAA